MRDVINTYDREDSHGFGVPLVSHLNNVSLPHALDFLSCSLTEWDIPTYGIDESPEDEIQRYIAIAPDTPEVREWVKTNLTGYWEYLYEEDWWTKMVQSLDADQWYEVYQLVNIATDNELEDFFENIGVNVTNQTAVEEFITEIVDSFELGTLPDISAEQLIEIIEAVDVDGQLTDWFLDNGVNITDPETVDEIIDWLDGNATAIDEDSFDDIVNIFDNITGAVSDAADTLNTTTEELIDTLYDILDRHNWTTDPVTIGVLREDVEDLDEITDGGLTDLFEEFNLNISDDGDAEVILEFWESLDEVLDFFRGLNETQVEDFIRDAEEHNASYALQQAEEDGAPANDDLKELFEDLDSTDFNWTEVEEVVENQSNETFRALEEFEELYDLLELLDAENTVADVIDSFFRNRDSFSWSDFFGTRRRLRTARRNLQVYDDNYDRETHDYCNGCDSGDDMVEGDGDCNWRYNRGCRPGLECGHNNCLDFDRKAMGWPENMTLHFHGEDDCCMIPEPEPMPVEFQLAEILLIWAIEGFAPDDSNLDASNITHLVADIEDAFNITIHDDFDGNPELEVGGTDIYGLTTFTDYPTCFENINDIIVWFDDSAAVQDYVKSKNYGKGFPENPPLAAAITMESVEAPHFKYTIRINQSSIPDTDWIDDPYTKNPVLLYGTTLMYFFSGFHGLQNGIDQAIMWGADPDHTASIGLHTFPVAAHTEDWFWLFFKALFPLFLEIAFSYPFVVICRMLVEEKVSRVRAGMKIMGLNMWIYWLSYLVFYTALFGVVSMLLVVMVMRHIIVYTDLFLIFVTFVLFGMQMTALSMLISTLFERPKIAAVVAWASFLILFYVWAFNAINHGGEDKKALSCLSGPSCFALGMIQIAQYEDYQIGVHWSNIWELTPTISKEAPDGDFRYGFTLVFMMFDTVLYFLLTVYFDNIIPSSIGVQQPFYYPLVPIWRLFFPPTQTEKEPDDCPEHVFRRFVQQRGDNDEVLVELKNLRKTYKAHGGQVEAVKNLSLEMFKNQVFCLLGHNGAGKSTTFNMLTGMTTVTSGDATVCGHSLVQELDAVRSNVGLCPQFDLLFPTLTVEEHLWFYGRLNGVKASELKQKSRDLVYQVGLEEKTHTASKALSGGQKRKLSVCMSLIGENPLVILDEPTAGMDPFARRATWELIKQNREGRCIILTTHFMDEADHLGDRIALLSAGELQCCGTSYFLKQLYNSGYEVTFSLRENADADLVTNFVYTYLPEARQTRECATEVVFWTDFDSNSLFPKFFEAVKEHQDRLKVENYGIQATTLEHIFHSVTKGTVPTLANPEVGDIIELNSPKGEREPSVSQASVSKENLAAFSSLVEGSNTTGTAMLGLGELAKPAPEAPKRAPQNSQPRPDPNAGSANFPGTVNAAAFTGSLAATALTGNLGTTTAHEVKPKEDGEPPALQMVEMGEVANNDAVCAPDPIFLRLDEPDFDLKIPEEKPTVLKHIYHMVKKRALSSVRDYRTYLCQIGLPIFFTLMSVVINWQWLVDQEPLLLTGSVYGSEHRIAYNCPNTTDLDPSVLQEEPWVSNLPEMHGQYVCYENDPYQMWSPTKNESYEFSEMSMFDFPAWQDSLLYHRFDDDVPKYNSLYINQVVLDEYVVVGLNLSGVHTLPISMNLGANVLYRYITGNPEATIETTNHPLPLVSDELFFQDTWNDFFSAIILVIAFCFVPSATLAVIVNERASQVKHMQLMAGISLPSYWTANFIFDFFTIALASALCVGVASFFGEADLEGDGAAAGMVLCLLFSWSVTPFTFMFSGIFANPSAAQGLFMLLELCLSVLLMIAVYIMKAFPETGDIADVLQAIGRFLPPYCMGDAFRNLSLRHVSFVWADGEEKSAWDWDVTGRNFTYMAGCGLGYFIVLVFVEVLSTRSLVSDPTVDYVYDKRDDDVIEEKRRIQSGAAGQDTISIRGLQKVYRSMVGLDPVVAVQDLWFTVPKQQVFGFLGLNGAGKTTTMKMLCGVIKPTGGNAVLNGYSIGDQTNTRQQVGYCPQVNALFPYLQVKETLEFFSYVRGYSKRQTDAIVDRLISDLSLNMFWNRQAQALSGGNKRKLSLAIAVTGRPPILLLDEPSSGMDPVSKRFMWNFISEDLRKNAAVMLTTHSMEECEALCQRIGIMANGELMCIGTQQHLKSKFGGDYQLDIALSEPDEAITAEITKFLQATFPEADLIEDYGLSMRLEVNVGDLELDVIFQRLEECQEQFDIMESYAISQPSLESIFIKFAQHQRKQLRGERSMLDCITNFCKVD